MRRALATLAAGALALGCAQGKSNSAEPGTEPATTAPAKPATDPQPVRGSQAVDVKGAADVDGAIGKQVRVHGVARDAKIAAAVVGSGYVVYCLNIESWTGDRHGKPVVAQGTLTRTDRFKATSENGEVTAGTPGGDLVIERCSF